MTSKSTTLLTITTILILAAGASPADAGGYVGVGVSNHGVSVGFGGSNWGIWGSSWGSAGWSTGFSASLSGYGEWVQVDGLGSVWRPWVAAGWQPYSHGRWVYTSLGWTWVAYEPWGWIPHHYGNWAYSTVGWVWTPGYTYHPGNVVWVSSGAYLGWYPSAPVGWSHGHRAYHHGWNNGYAWGRHDGYRQGYNDGWRDARYATWVPRNQVTADNVATHRVGHEVATRSVARSRVTPLPSAPSKTEVERMVGRSVPETAISERTARIDGRDTRVVRPEGQRSTVERHGGETVRTALTPAARDRVVGRTASTTSSTRRSDTRSQSYSPTASRNIDSDRGRTARVPSADASGSKRADPRNTAPTSQAAPARRSVSVDQRQPVSNPPATHLVQRSERPSTASQTQSPPSTTSRTSGPSTGRKKPAVRVAPSRSQRPESTANDDNKDKNDNKETRVRTRPARESSKATAEKSKRTRRTRG